MKKRLRLYSDLHQEHKNNQFKIKKLEDEKNQILILAGDISLMSQILKGDLDSFFKDLSDRFFKVLYVLGNHEYYGKSLVLGDRRSSEKVKEYFSKFENILILDRFSEGVEINSVVFVGAPLFTNLNNANPALINKYESNDFKMIAKYCLDGRYSKFKPAHWLREFNSDFAYIKNMVEQNKDKEMVLITHYPMSEMCTDKVEDPESYYTSYYRTKLDHFIKQNSNIKMCLFGHIHQGMEFMIGNTKIKSNPIGYDQVEDLNANNSFVD